MSIDPGFQAQQRMRAESAELADKDLTPGEDVVEDHEEHAFGEQCARCGRLIEEHDDVRRNAAGKWVHQNC